MEDENRIFGELPKIVIGEIITIAVILFVFFGLEKFDLSVVWGCLLGGGTNILCFAILCITVEKMIQDNEKGLTQKAKSVQLVSYLFRMGLMAVALVIALKNENFQPIATAIPLLMTRPILTVTTLLDKKNKKQENKKEQSK